MKFIHTSDWHIGRQFHNVSLLEDQRHVLNELAQVIEREQIDALLISGDIYDRSVPPARAVALLDEVIDHINGQLEVPIILIAGNHDSGERLGFASRQLAASSLYMTGLLSAEPSPVLLKDQWGGVAFYGLPYADPATVRAITGEDVHSHDEAMGVLTDQIRRHNPSGRRCVLLGHCFVSGCSVSDSERPLSVGGVEQVSADHFKGFDYVALGHLHGPQHRAIETIRYSGSILKYSFSEENQTKSVTLVDMNGDGQCRLTQIPLDAPRDMRTVEGMLDELLKRGREDPAADDYLMVRLQDKHAILDVMGKLREVYPNVLHLERPGLLTGGERKAPDRDHLQRAEMPLFRDFYQQMTGDELGEDGAAIVAEILDSLHTAGEAN